VQPTPSIHRFLAAVFETQHLLSADAYLGVSLKSRWFLFEGSITDVRAEVELGDMASVSMKSIAGS